MSLGFDGGKPVVMVVLPVVIVSPLDGRRWLGSAGVPPIALVPVTEIPIGPAWVRFPYDQA